MTSKLECQDENNIIAKQHSCKNVNPSNLIGVFFQRWTSTSIARFKRTGRKSEHLKKKGVSLAFELNKSMKTWIHLDFLDGVIKFFSQFKHVIVLEQSVTERICKIKNKVKCIKCVLSYIVQYLYSTLINTWKMDMKRFILC